MKLDFDDLTNAEIIEIEDRSGVPFSAIGPAFAEGNRPVGKVMTALMAVALRRENSSLSFDDAWGEALNKKVSDLEMGVDEDPSTPPSETSD